MNKNKIIKFQKPNKQTPEPISKGVALFNEGVVFYEQGNYDIAYKKFIEAEKLGFKSIILYNNIICILECDCKKNIKKILKYIDKSIKYDDKYGANYLLKGFALSEVGDYEKALEAFLKAYKLGCDDPLIYVQISEIYHALNDYLKEIAFISNGLKKYPNCKECLICKGNSYYLKNDILNALKYYLKADEQGIFQCYSKAEEQNKCNAKLYYNISCCYRLIKDYKNALIYANKEIFTDKTSSRGYYIRGTIYSECGNLDEALESYLEAEKCVSHHKFLDQMYWGMSNIYLNKQDYENAKKYIEKAISINNKNADFYFTKGGINYIQKNFSEALKLYKKAYELGKRDSDLIVVISITYIILKKYKLALAFIDKHFPSSQDKYSLLSSKASALYMLKKYQEAKGILEELHKINPTDIAVIQSYAAVILETEKNYKKIIQLLEPFKEHLAEIDPYSCFVLSLSYFKTGSYKESLNLLNEYANFVPLEMFQYKDKQDTKKLVNNLYKRFGLNDELKNIINIFSKVIIFPKYI